MNIRLPIKRSLRPMTFVDYFGTYSKKSSSMFCLFWEVSVNIRLPIKRSLRPMTLVDCFGTYSKKSSSKKLSHLQQVNITSTTLTPSAT